MSDHRRLGFATVGLALATFLGACSMNPPVESESQAASPDVSTTADASAPAGDLRVGIASREILNDYNRDINDGAQSVFESAGATVTVTNGDGDATKQANDITTLINSGIDILFVQLGDPTQLEPVIAQAVEQDITVVTAGVGSLVDGAIADVGGDEEMMAEMSARHLFESIGGKGDVYAFWVPGAPLLETRIAVLDEVAEEYPDITIHREPTDHSPATVQSQMQTILTANPDPGSIAGVWGAYDQLVSGAVQAIQSSNRGEDIQVVAIDGDRATFNMLFAEGSPFVATVVQNAQQIGSLGAEAALADVNGEEIGETLTSAWIATRHNGIAAAEERYGSEIWAEIGLDPDAIAQQWEQNEDVEVVQP